jgi:cell division protein FtsB
VTGSGGGADYPRLRQQIVEKEADMARMRCEAEAAAAEVEKLQLSLSKAKRQASVKVQEKDATIKASVSLNS